MSGFQNAGITKGIMMLVGVATLTASLTDMKPYLHLQLVPHMTTYHQFWRILVHPFAFANSTELLLAEVLLYHVGIHIERSFGPRKYSSFILVSSLVSTILSMACLILLNPFGINSIPAGPYGIIFSLLWQHHRTVPALYAFKLLGIEGTNKSFMYMLAVLLALSSPPTSVVAALIGLSVGYLYRTDTLIPLPTFSRRRGFRPLKSYRIPLSIYTLLARLFTPLASSTPPRSRARRVLPGQVDGRTTAVAAQQRAGLRNMLATMAPAQSAQPVTAAAGTPRPIPTAEPGSARRWMNAITSQASGTRAPTEEEISSMSIVFPNLSREVIVRALQSSDNNTAEAVMLLLQDNP